MSRSLPMAALLAGLALAACDRPTAIDSRASATASGPSGDGLRVGAPPPAASGPASSIYSITSPRNSP
jgi:hypothetical protein